VFLMTTGDRYQQYYMSALAGKIYFFRLNMEEKGVIEHDLATMHITSIDTPDKKVLCKSRRHFGFQVSNENGHRKLYFMTFD